MAIATINPRTLEREIAPRRIPTGTRRSIGRWHSGAVYVVQPGDTLTTIAQLVSPENPDVVRRALVTSLRSDVVVPGERVVIP